MIQIYAKGSPTRFQNYSSSFRIISILYWTKWKDLFKYQIWGISYKYLSFNPTQTQKQLLGNWTKTPAAFNIVCGNPVCVFDGQMFA